MIEVELMHHVIIVEASCDWQGLYVDGELMEEGHLIEPEQIGKYVPIIELDKWWLTTEADAKLREWGRFGDWGKLELSDFSPEEFYRG